MPQGRSRSLRPNLTPGYTTESHSEVSDKVETLCKLFTVYTIMIIAQGNGGIYGAVHFRAAYMISEFERCACVELKPAVSRKSLDSMKSTPDT